MAHPTPLRVQVLGLTGDMAVRFTRRQFPLKLAWVMTINKSQGQTLRRVGVRLPPWGFSSFSLPPPSSLIPSFFLDKSQGPDPVFAHGQLYVAMSRVSTCQSLRVAARVTADEDPVENGVINVVWAEVFR